MSIGLQSLLHSTLGPILNIEWQKHRLAIEIGEVEERLRAWNMPGCLSKRVALAVVETRKTRVGPSSETPSLAMI